MQKSFNLINEMQNIIHIWTRTANNALMEPKQAKDVNRTEVNESNVHDNHCCHSYRSFFSRTIYEFVNLKINCLFYVLKRKFLFSLVKGVIKI
jgi:hypothetical protein